MNSYSSPRATQRTSPGSATSVNPQCAYWLSAIRVECLRETYAQQVLAALGLADAVKGKTVLGTDVRQVLADVETASADAGLVYATDAAISPGVRVVADAPENSHLPIIYPVAVLRSSAHQDAARAFVQFLQGGAARTIFQKYGFRPAVK